MGELRGREDLRRGAKPKRLEQKNTGVTETRNAGDLACQGTQGLLVRVGGVVRPAFILQQFLELGRRHGQ